MKPSARSPEIQYPFYLQSWILLSVIIGLFLFTAIQSYGEEGHPHQENPHGDLSNPMVPPPGIIGVALHLTAERIGDPAGLFIRATHPMGPAAKMGVMHGQEILAVDDMPIKGKTYQEVVALIRGEVGQSVTLRVKTFAEVKEVKIIRISEQQLTEGKQT